MALSAHQLTLWRGELCLFDALSFDLQPAEVLQLRGPNGSGKTTLLRILCGLTRPEAGEVRWQGRPLEQQRAAWGEALAWCGHLTGLKADLSLAENLAFAARLGGKPGSAWQPWLEQLGLTACAQLPVRHLSAGQQRRGALARALMSAAQVWLFDEPFTNLDVAGREWLEAQLDQHLERGGIAVLAAHHELRARPGLKSLELAEPA